MGAGFSPIRLLEASVDLGQEVEVLHRLLDRRIRRKLVHGFEQAIVRGFGRHGSLIHWWCSKDAGKSSEGQS